MPGGIEQIDPAIAVRKLHHRGRYGDTSLLLQRHPVRGGVGPFFTLHRARHLNSLAKQQQLFRHRRFTRVGVRDNGKGATRIDVAL